MSTTASKLNNACDLRFVSVPMSGKNNGLRTLRPQSLRVRLVGIALNSQPVHHLARPVRPLLQPVVPHSTSQRPRPLEHNSVFNLSLIRCGCLRCRSRRPINRDRRLQCQHGLRTPLLRHRWCWANHGMTCATVHRYRLPYARLWNATTPSLPAAKRAAHHMHSHEHAMPPHSLQCSKPTAGWHHSPKIGRHRK